VRAWGPVWSPGQLAVCSPVTSGSTSEVQVRFGILDFRKSAGAGYLPFASDGRSRISSANVPASFTHYSRNA
jgi:hypothetical protein